MVADLLMRSGEEERGLRMLLKMTDVEVTFLFDSGICQSLYEDRLT